MSTSGYATKKTTYAGLTPHSTLHTPHSTLHTPHSTLHIPHSTLHIPHSTLHTSHSTLTTYRSDRRCEGSDAQILMDRRTGSTNPALGCMVGPSQLELYMLTYLAGQLAMIWGVSDWLTGRAPGCVYRLAMMCNAWWVS